MTLDVASPKTCSMTFLRKADLIMNKCDDSKCSGVQRSECIVRDYFRFEIERSPADEETAITRLLIEAGGVFNPRAVAKHLVAHGVVMKG
mgnify:CR=1 FL=1